jgi:para-aminobenzoate synthetase component 1
MRRVSRRRAVEDHTLDWIEPDAAFAAVADLARPVLLESALDDGRTGRFSIVAADPSAIVECAAGRADDPFVALEASLAETALEPDPDLPVLPGAIGFLAYEAGRFADRMPSPQATGLVLPDAAFGLYDTILVLDHATRRAVLRTAGDGTRLLRRFRNAPPVPPVDWTPRGVWREETDGDAYRSGVETVRRFIAAGDIYQANLTLRRLAPLPPGLAPSMLYRRLRALTPAPFAALLDLGAGRWIASASPERFLAVDAAGRVETRPIKGTRPRGRTPDEDAALAAELLASAKDRAENLMIVDLLRNDLSRVCAVGSVRVPVLCGLETFPRVHHLVSVVTGRLAAGRSAVDLLRAAFPGGSITGAPKIRAMEIIRALEPSRRGAYCGSVFRIGYDGSLDSSIVIRTLTGAGGTVAAQAGGGIVYDSDPDAEWEEAMTKIAPLLRALAGPAA